MLRNGIATVYEAKFGSEFGRYEAKYRAAEEKAKESKIGLWAQPGIIARLLKGGGEKFESPREYKTRMTAKEKAGAGGKPPEAPK